MRGPKVIGFVLAFALPLGAQEYQVLERQLGAYKGKGDAVRAVMKYCDAVDDSVNEQGPRIFAEPTVDSTTRSTPHGWTEFASKEAWEAAGARGPLAFVWSRKGAIVRVTIIASRVGLGYSAPPLNGSTTATAPTPN